MVKTGAGRYEAAIEVVCGYEGSHGIKREEF